LVMPKMEDLRSPTRISTILHKRNEVTSQLFA
jgi:hypothetical protein